MLINWASVNWPNVLLLSAVVFVAALIGNFLSLRKPLLGAVFAAVLFAALLIVLEYYPHGFELPLPKSG